MPILLSCLSALSVTVFSVILIRPLALRLQLVDIPGGRKQHEGEVPLIGGIALFLGFNFALLTLPISLSSYRSFLAAYALLVVIGVLDDFHELSARARFLAQIIAGLLMTCWGGVIIHSLGNLLFTGDIFLHHWGIPFTVLAVVGVINAVNMTDGLDGLASGLVLITMGLLSWLAAITGALNDVYLLSLLIFAVTGFLCFNLRFSFRQQALIFMGDAGSMPLGFTLAWFLVSLSQGDHPAAKPVTMLWLMAVPLFDMVAVMLRRIWSRRSPFSPDREHIHHLLLAMGLRSNQAVISLYGIALACGLLGIAAQQFNFPDGIMFFSFLSAFIIYLVLSENFWKGKR